MPIHRATTAATILAAIAGTAHGQPSAAPFPAQFNLSSLNGASGFVMSGIDPSDFSGGSVSSAGDVNGDGIDDLIIGATGANPNGQSYAGESYVVFGAANVGASGSLNLSSLNGTNGFVINGIDLYDSSGCSVSSAGDVNGDGIDDLIVGAWSGDSNGQSNAGESYVVFGAANIGASGSLNLSSLDGTNGFVINGIDPNDRSGDAVSSAGDVNGDGVDDLLVGAQSASPNGQAAAGESYVVFGAANVGASGSLNLSSLNGANGFIINGIDANGSSGRSVSSAGDVNGDGIHDLIIGAYRADPDGRNDGGESYVVFGAANVGASGSLNLSALNGTNGFVLNGIDVADQSGVSVSSAGDVNNDGIDDLIIGAAGADPSGRSNAGESYVVFGAANVGASGSMNLSSLNGANGFIINGIDANDGSGRAVSSAGDVNSDGIDDLIIGAHAADPNGQSNAGESYVVFGAANVGASGSFNLSALNGANGFIINGIDANDGSSRSVSSAGDVNGDGVDDLIIGAESADPNGQSSAGESYVVFGRANANVWTSPTGGSWEVGANWRTGAKPTAGFATINTPIGVTVTGPSGALFIDGLALGATLGRTTLDLQPFSLLGLANDFTIPTSAAISGAGTLATDAAFTNNGLINSIDLTLIATGGLTNAGDIKLQTLSPASPSVALQVYGALTNAPAGELFIRGAAELLVSDGLSNQGTTSITFASATLEGPITNAGTSDGMGGFTVLGRISISGASQVALTDDLLNQSEIVLTTDSSLVVLGELTGNGVTGPGGGAGGAVFLEGGFNPGFPLARAIASFGGNLNLGFSNTTTIEIGGTTPGADLDQIATLANFAAGGTLIVELVPGFTPSPGDQYQVLQFATASGAFSNIILDPALITAGAETDQLLTLGVIVVPPAFCPGNANGDNIVDFNDINAVIANWLSNYAPGTGPGDANNDGTVDFNDINAVIANWLAPCP